MGRIMLVLGLGGYASAIGFVFSYLYIYIYMEIINTMDKIQYNGYNTMNTIQ